jgi:hypothetical protein
MSNLAEDLSMEIDTNTRKIKYYQEHKNRQIDPDASQKIRLLTIQHNCLQAARRGKDSVDIGWELGEETLNIMETKFGLQLRYFCKGDGFLVYTFKAV